MQISKLSAIGFLLGAAILQGRAQSDNSVPQGKAVELLRQTIAEERQRPSEVIPAPARPVPATQQDQAVERLRRTIAQDRNSSIPAEGKMSNPAKSAKVKAPSGTAPTPSKANPPGAEVTAGTPPAPTVNSEAGGPKTKQQRLMDLLELYRSDKLTPAQYQTERAKILAQP